MSDSEESVYDLTRDDSSEYSASEQVLSNPKLLSYIVNLSLPRTKMETVLENPSHANAYAQVVPKLNELRVEYEEEITKYPIINWLEEGLSPEEKVYRLQNMLLLLLWKLAQEHPTSGSRIFVFDKHYIRRRSEYLQLHKYGKRELHELVLHEAESRFPNATYEMGPFQLQEDKLPRMSFVWLNFSKFRRGDKTDACKLGEEDQRSMNIWFRTFKNSNSSRHILDAQWLMMEVRRYFNEQKLVFEDEALLYAPVTPLVNQQWKQTVDNLRATNASHCLICENIFPKNKMSICDRKLHTICNQCIQRSKKPNFCFYCQLPTLWNKIP